MASLNWREALHRFAKWDAILQVAFLIIMFVIAGILVLLEGRLERLEADPSSSIGMRPVPPNVRCT